MTIEPSEVNCVVCNEGSALKGMKALSMELPNKQNLVINFTVVDDELSTIDATICGSCLCGTLYHIGNEILRSAEPRISLTSN
jgi:hypothetical protein